jgi:hypothetical protein
LNIPDTVRILGVDYGITYESRLNNGSSLAYGHIDYEKSMIRLNNDDAKEQRLQQTLLHEIIHGVVYHMGFDLGEGKTNKLATGLLAVINDNPQLFARTENDAKETD